MNDTVTLNITTLTLINKIHKGRLLENSEKTIETTKLENNDKVTIAFKIRGGMFHISSGSIQEE